MSKPATQLDDVMDNIPYYDKWQLGEGIPIVKTFFVQDLKKVDLKPWARTGGSGAFINMEGAEGATGAYVSEIAAGKKLNPMKHLYEDLHFVLKGRGATTIWNEGGKKHTLEWQKGSLFSTPLNTWHQHFNAQGSEPVRLISLTDAPVVINRYRNLDYIFNNHFTFSDRYEGGADAWSGAGGRYLGSEIRMAPGASIPARCIVGIGSVITKSFHDEYQLIAGVPAVQLKELDEDGRFLTERKTRNDLPDDI